VTAAEKGANYVAQGRLIVRALDEYAGTVQADCRGVGAVYALGRDEGGWFCSCRARGTCSHLHALGLVVALEPRGTS
jgi:hypothetical protein